METFGKKIVDKQGRVFYQLDYVNEGFSYKNEEAFLNNPDEVCYVPEYAVEEGTLVPSNGDCYTRKSLLELCEGNEDLCTALFYELSWQYPETLLNEWEMNGTIDEFDK